VLGNDSDANGDTLSAIKVSDPSHGTITNWNANGSFTYTPTAGYSGTDAFTYKANDGTADSSTVTVNITVVATTPGAVTSAFMYDGDGNRVKKTEGGETTLYVNRYYEKNLTTGEVTTHYFLGDKEIAYKNNAGIRYVHQDHLGGTSVTTDTTGATVGTIKYFPFGATRSTTGTLDTGKKFTGQRLDETGLYFYNARYYDANIGRFISADTVISDYKNPQTLNRYTYCLDNPLKYTDPTGHADKREVKWYGYDIRLDYWSARDLIFWLKMAAAGCGAATFFLGRFFPVGAAITALSGFAYISLALTLERANERYRSGVHYKQSWAGVVWGIESR